MDDEVGVNYLVAGAPLELEMKAIIAPRHHPAVGAEKCMAIAVHGAWRAQLPEPGLCLIQLVRTWARIGALDRAMA